MSPPPVVRPDPARRRLLAAGAAVAAAAGMFALWPRPLPGDAVLLGLAVAGAGDPAGAGAPRGAIALARPGAPARLLAAELWSADGAALSYDGRRVVFAGRRQASGTASLFTMRPDGAGLREITAGHGAPADPVWLPDGRIVFSDAVSAERAGEGGGRALYTCGADGTRMTRLTWGEQRDSRPEVLPDGRIGFFRRAAGSGEDAPAARMAVHPDGTGLTARPGEPASRSLVEAAAPVGRAETEHEPPPGYTILAAQSAAARPRPPVLTSVVDASKSTGTLLCLDAYHSRLPEIGALARGSIDRVRVETLTPAGLSPAVLGEAPVHADGSFFIEVPADTPLRLALLARDGRILARLDSGVWVRPNENRGCIGCHEPSDRVPENRRPLAVDDPPVRLPATLAMHGGDHEPR